MDSKIDRRSLLLGSLGAAMASALPASAAPATKPRNIIFVLTDDQRYDALGFMKPQSFLETPNMDRLAREGAHCKNTFVSTALCSPSRASILTGKYAFQHRIVDNNTAFPAGTVFFPQYLQKAGYQTAFIGKWHMGNGGDQPQPGFDHWVSFKGQGTYLPNPNGLNVDGQHVPQKGYITDELTDYALNWLDQQPKDRPYFLYLSHKAVHSEFISTGALQGEVRQRNVCDAGECRAAEESGRAAAHVGSESAQQLAWNRFFLITTRRCRLAIITSAMRRLCWRLMIRWGGFLKRWTSAGKATPRWWRWPGDNGFCFGEHGLIDKRQAYEESIRIPLLIRCPELIRAKTVVTEDLANIDFMPTFLDVAGVECPKDIAGQSFLPILEGKKIPWRDSLLYTYYWERNFPQTPTMHAIRTDRFKYVHYYGIWDTDELYDLQEDPHELRNLINSVDHQKIMAGLKQKLFSELQAKGGLYIPLFPDNGPQMNRRNPDGAHAADFPTDYYSKPKVPGSH